uniref:Uncharacterized protein n=1 Tax=Arundo donax TaxID=35708 RepID=A0A0A9CTY6_ARUDO
MVPNPWGTSRKSARVDIAKSGVTFRISYHTVNIFLVPAKSNRFQSSTKWHSKYNCVVNILNRG